MRKLALFFALVATMSAETVTDTLRDPSGTAVDATMTICWSASYIDVDGNPVPAGCLAPFDTSSGLFSVVLDANDTNTPAGTSYAVSFRYSNGTTTSQTWVVPTSVSALGITDVFSAVTPVPSATINVSLIAAGTNSVNLTWTGTHDYSGGILELPNSTALIATQCDAANEAGRIYVDTDATSGQQVYVCEGLAGWVLQGDGGGAGGGDNITVNATAATNANFLDNTDISFSLDVGATPDDITASYVAGSIVDADINASAAIAGSKLNVAFTDLTGTATDAQVPDTITVDLATLATTATTANAGDSATGFFPAGAIEAARGGTAIDTSASTGFAQVAAGTWSVAAILDADVPDTITIANSSQITTNSAGDLSSGTVPVARVGADHIDSAGEVAADVIGTSELSDAADTPVLGHFLRIPADTAAVEYGDLIGGAGITLGDVGGDVTINADVTPTGTNTFSGTNDFTTGIVLLPGAAGAPAAGLCTSATVDRVYVDTADGGLTYICLQRGPATYTWEILLTAGDFSADATVTDAGAVAVVDDSHAHTATTISALDTADVTTGTWADARVAESNVTQHQAALSVTESQISDLSHTPDIDAVTGQANWGTAATKETADLIISGVEVDFEAGGAEGYPRLAQSITPPAADCNEAAEAGRLYFDSDADTDGSVFICLGTGGWKDIDDDGGAGGFSSFLLDGDNASPQTITDGNTATIAGTAPISTVAAVTDTVTISLDANGVDATHLAATITLAATDLLDLSGIDASTATEGILLPQHATACSGGTAEGQPCWEADANILHIGDGSTIQDFPPASAISGDATMTGTGVVSIQADSVALTTDTTGNYVLDVADGTGIDGTASGEGATYTPVLDLTEEPSPTFGDGTSAITLTLDGTGGTDVVIASDAGVATLNSGRLTHAAGVFIDATDVTYWARKASPGTLNPGDVVYVSSYNAGTGFIEVELADSDDASAMPSLGIAKTTITNASEGEVTEVGELDGIDTSSFSAGDELYVSTTAGALTATPPTGEAAQIQKIAVVLRSHVSLGVVEVIGAGRSNATPNLDSAAIFVGNSSNQSVAVDVTGDVLISNTGVTTVQANSVALTTDTTGNYAAGDAEAGAALTGDSATAFFAAGAIEAARGGTGTDTSATTGIPQISAGTWGFNAGVIHLAVSSSANLRAVINDEVGGTGNLVFNANPVLAGATINGADLILNDGATDSPQVQFLPQTGTQWNLFVADVDDDFRLEVNTASTELYEAENIGAGVIDLTVDGTITGTTAVAGPNVTSGADPGHTHTGASLSALDISDDTNLAVTAPVVLTDDTLSLAGDVVLEGQANTWTTGAQDFSAATSLTAPVAAGAAPTVSGQIAYDSTANQLEYGDNTVNRIVVNTDEAQTLSGKTMSAMTVGATDWTNATHAHAAANSGGQISLNNTTGDVATAQIENDAVTRDKVEAELRTHVQSFSIDPTVAATGEAQFRWGYPITLTEIRCDTDAGTVASTNVEERAPTTPNTAGTAALTTALTCDTNSETGTVFTNATIDAWDPVALVYGTVTTATILRVYVEFTID